MKHDQFPLPAYSIPLIWNTIKGISSLGVVFSLIICYNLREQRGRKVMRTFNYSAIREQKWDSDILGLVAAIY